MPWSRTKRFHNLDEMANCCRQNDEIDFNYCNETSDMSQQVCKQNIGAVYTREYQPRLTLAAVYIRRERNHFYEYGVY